MSHRGKKILSWVIGFISLYVILTFHQGRPIQQRPPLNTDNFQRIAHRCGAALYPENTLFACRKVWQEGLADILEIDVRMSKDGELVLMHDATVNRTTDGSGRVEEFTWAELQKLDAGYAFEQNGEHPFRGQGITIPRLAEIFRKLPQAHYIIEIKGKDPKSIKPVIRLLHQHNLTKQVVLGAFHDNIVQRLRHRAPNMAYYGARDEITNWVLLHRAGLAGWMSPDFQLMALPTKLGPFDLDRSILQRARVQNLKVYVWSINDRQEMNRLIDLRVDGIMTDRPKLLDNLAPTMTTPKSP